MDLELMFCNDLGYRLYIDCMEILKVIIFLLINKVIVVFRIIVLYR